MYASQAQLLLLSQKNVLEIRFRRRHEKPNWNDFRRMLCTLDVGILDSAPGMIALRFKRPTQPPAYNYWARGLVCVFDIFWGEYRMISCEACDIITVIPSRPPEVFWNYFNQYLHAMSPYEMVQFANR